MTTSTKGNLLEKPRPKGEIVIVPYTPARKDIVLIYTYSSDAAAFVARECPTFGQLALNDEYKCWILLISPGFDIDAVLRWVRLMGIDDGKEVTEEIDPVMFFRNALLRLDADMPTVLKPKKARKKKNSDTDKPDDPELPALES